MGDTGSMAIGGALAGFAIVTGTEALLLLIGGLFLIEVLSVMIQVVSFKYWGRRVFLIAPIHHHFEMKAWSETKIVVRFWIIAALLCASGFVLFYRYYLQFPPMRRALVLGLARSGEAARAALEARGVEVAGADRSLGNDEELALLEGTDVLVKSPGVPGEAVLVQAARAHGIPVWSEIELAFRFLPDNPLLAVTGTKGKTTTSELLGHILAAPVAGNVGRPLSGLVGKVEPGTPIVCEVSSFQLEDVDTFAPAVAVLLNLERDHLDRHGTVEAYWAAKRRIFENQGRDDVAVVPSGFGRIEGAARRVEFDAGDELPAEPLIPGAHNRANAAAAVAAARAAGAGEEEIATGLRTFPGVPHRLEPVAKIGGVRYVNDSIATNTLRGPQRTEDLRRAAPPHPRRPAEGRAVRRARSGRSLRRTSSPRT